MSSGHMSVSASYALQHAQNAAAAGKERRLVGQEAAGMCRNKQGQGSLKSCDTTSAFEEPLTAIEQTRSEKYSRWNCNRADNISKA